MRPHNERPPHTGASTQARFVFGKPFYRSERPNTAHSRPPGPGEGSAGAILTAGALLGPARPACSGPRGRGPRPRRRTWQPWRRSWRPRIRGSPHGSPCPPACSIAGMSCPIQLHLSRARGRPAASTRASLAQSHITSGPHDPASDSALWPSKKLSLGKARAPPPTAPSAVASGTRPARPLPTSSGAPPFGSVAVRVHSRCPRRAAASVCEPTVTVPHWSGVGAGPACAHPLAPAVSWPHLAAR
jgi:hypothetical protein